MVLNNKTKRYYAVFEGNVQGVGFRFFAQQEAEKLGLTGWVRNRSDGKVDIEVDGEELKVMTFLKNLKSKHPWANIVSENHTEKTVSDIYTGFKIRY